MLEIKNFEERKRIADNIESQFLEIYFGKNPEIVKFAKTLIQDGHKAAAKALNQSVKVFGEKINPEVVIPVILKDFNVCGSHIFQTVKQIRALMQEIEDKPLYSGFEKSVFLIWRLGGSFVTENHWLSFASYRVVLGEINQYFHNILAFERWVVQKLIPQFKALGDVEFVNFLNAASN